jgi:hypothetical protein
VYTIFTIACVVLLIVSMVATFIVMNFIGQIMRSNYDIDDVWNLDQLSAAVQKTQMKRTIGKNATRQGWCKTGVGAPAKISVNRTSSLDEPRPRVHVALSFLSCSDAVTIYSRSSSS